MAETFKPPGAEEWHFPITAGQSKDIAKEGPNRNFFGSEKAGRVREIANTMLDQENKLSGGMLDDMISLALTEPELDRDGTSQRLLQKFKFDAITGDPLSHSAQADGLRASMQYFDELQELRDKVLEQRKGGK